MKDHFFISETDGSLHDTRDTNWSSSPLRKNYSRHHREIKTVADVKATLRAGAFAWPGGYPLYFVTNHGCALSFDAVRDNLQSIMGDLVRDDYCKIVGCDVNYEDDDLVCDHTGEPIESAYVD